MGLRRLLSVLLVLLACAMPAWAATGTVMPIPVFQGFDNSGNPISSGKLCSYTAGTTTPANTYSDVALATPNANPVILDSAGRATVFLTPGQSYKFILRTAGSDTTCNTGTIIWTQDNISAVPSSSANLDVLGTAGEAITAGQAVYLSDGSGAKTAGQWYKGDNTAAYSSTVGPVGIAPNTITSGTAGTIRIAGQVTGLTSLTLGATYYIGTGGALTSTAPTNNIRSLGRADSSSSLILNANPNVPPPNLSDCNGRLSLTTAVPVTVADVTAATTVRWVPYKGNRCALYDGTQWTLRTFAEVSIAVPATTSSLYDVFLYDNAGTLALELSAAWSSDVAIFGSGTYQTTRPTQDAIYVKSTNGTTVDATRRYLGTFRTTGVSGQTEDSFAKRYVWNYYNRLPRIVRRFESTTSWTYSSSTIHQANASASNQVDVVVGVAEVRVTLRLIVTAAGDTINREAFASIGEDSTSTFSANAAQIAGLLAAANTNVTLEAALDVFPTVGRHFYAWVEATDGTGTTTWYGLNTGASNRTNSGVTGFIEG